MKVVFYGRLAEAIAPSIDMDAATCSIAELRRRLAVEHPLVADSLASKRSRALVGTSVVNEDYLVGSNDRIEFLPPVSGG